MLTGEHRHGRAARQPELDLAGEDDRARNLTILPDGNILVVGSGKLDADNIDAMAVLLDPDGALVESRSV